MSLNATKIVVILYVQNIQLMSSELFSGYKMKYGVRVKHFPLMNKTTEGL
jgi:hypothetical protein